MKGHFISIEGTDGAGKTTQIPLILQYLHQKGFRVCQTREPGGTAVGEGIRALVLNPKWEGLSPKTELLLYAAARAQHLTEVILPALSRGEVVLSDRFTDSSAAYQGFGRELSHTWVAEVNRLATDGIQPDLTLYLAMPPEAAILRKQQETGHAMDRLEQEKADFHARVYQGFETLAKENPQRIRRIDATQSIEDVFLQIQRELDAYFCK